MDNKFKQLATKNIVPIIMIIFIMIITPMSNLSLGYLAQEMMLRLSRNTFLVLSLIIPVVAGMGLNFGIVLGAMAGQIGLIFITDWHVVGVQGLFLAIIISIPVSIMLGVVGGAILNRARGKEMITSMIMGFFINGIYQLVVLYGMGNVIPMHNKKIVLTRGYGIRNAIDLKGVRRGFDQIMTLHIGKVDVPLFTLLLIAILCVFIVWFRKTKLGHDMRAVGQDIEVAKASGIAIERTRILSIVISTVLASIGQIIFLQNIGTMNTYNSHEQIGMFSIAAILIGGATAARASIPNAILGIVLFHLIFVISPRAGKELLGSAQIGEFFRVFVSYGIIAMALVLHQWRRGKEKKAEREKILNAQLKRGEN